ncbi:MAG: TonB-dependent receptor [Pseudomonadota bacterium]
MTFTVSRKAALSSLALAISSSFAFAQNAPEVFVTATRAPQAAADVLSDHVLLSSEDIVRSGAVTIVDLLQKQRGIEVARNGGPGSNASVFIRGADSKQTVVLVDGVRIGSSTSGIANWSALPLANIDRIEIVYGPLATMYGADAIGGVVQVFTKRGAGAPQMTGAIGAGSDKARSADASISGGAGSVSYAFTVARDQDEGFSATKPGSFSYNPDLDGYEKTSASGQLVFTVAPGHEAGVLFMRSKLDAQFDGGASAFDVRSRQDQNNIALFSKHRLATGWNLKLQASRADDKSISIANASATGTSAIDTRLKAYSAQSDFAIGTDLLQMLLERREEDATSNSSAALNVGRTTNSGALAYSLKRGAHLGSASVRLDDSSQYGSETTGAIGYGYRFTPSLRANASVSTSFRAPAFNELYYPGYGVASNRPEQGKNVEAGLAWHNGSLEATAVYYRNRLTDLLVSTSRCPVEVATHPFGCAYNVNRATLSGLSVGARASFGKLDLNGTFDLQDPRDDTTGKQLVRRARRHANLSAEYSMGAMVAGLGVHLSGKRFDDSANRNALGGYGLLNVFASYRFAEDWTLIGRWNNATDKRYELARNYATAGSQLFAAIRYGAK